jgi:hypothetical protein
MGVDLPVNQATDDGFLARVPLRMETWRSRISESLAMTSKTASAPHYFDLPQFRYASKRTTPPKRNMIARRRCVLELGPQIPQQ